jgi:chemotaxis protein methyltransferase CheR
MIPLKHNTHPSKNNPSSDNRLAKCSHFLTENLGLSEKEFNLLRDLVHETTGIYYDNDQKELLADKIAPLIVNSGFSSFLDYYYYLKYDNSAAEEWNRLLDCLVVPETYFWRESDQLHALTKYIVPAFYRSNPGQPLKIWSAACCSGEEPISIAIALNEDNWFSKMEIQITASDTSQTAIAKANIGLYKERSFRCLPLDLKLKYFTQENQQWKISQLIKEKINYKVLNLFSPTAKEYAQAHIIFCRNVFIYFSRVSILKVIDVFHENMLDPGYLFLGAAESLINLTNKFELNTVGKAFVYKKTKIAKLDTSINNTVKAYER